MMAKLLKYKKVLLLINTLIMYFVTLNLISATKNIPETQILEENAVVMTDFTTKTGQQFVLAGHNKLEFRHGEGLKELTAPVSLTEGIAFDVLATISVPEESAGKTLYIDLYRYNDYDNDLSQINSTLEAGENRVRGTLSYGEMHPDICELRIFTTDDIDASISDIQIDRLEPFEGITENIAISTALLIFFAFLLVLIGLLHKRVK